MDQNDIIKVLVVDDHTVVRRGIVFVLQTFTDIQAVGEADSIEAAVEACLSVQPDVVLMDMKMAGETDGVIATREIRNRFPDTQVIALTSYHDAEMVEQVIQAGALGYLLKDVSTDELAQAIRLAHAGKLTLAPEAAEDLMQAKVYSEEQDSNLLTDRQIEVLVLLSRGLTNPEIAQQLNVSKHTARHHVSEILGKLNAANRAEAVAIAIQRGILKQ